MKCTNIKCQCFPSKVLRPEPPIPIGTGKSELPTVAEHTVELSPQATVIFTYAMSADLTVIDDFSQ